MNSHLASYHSLDPWDSSVIGSFDDDTPILLMPVRIETRFETFMDGPTQKYQLWVRIYPDDIAVETHESALSPSEVASGLKFKSVYFDNSSTTTEKLNAWNSLCVSNGMERAAWIAKYYEDRELNSSLPDDEKFDIWTYQPRTQVMPDKFVCYAYDAYDPTTSNNPHSVAKKGKPIPHTLKVGISTS
jgi:hypothetical protein